MILLLLTQHQERLIIQQNNLLQQATLHLTQHNSTFHKQVNIILINLHLQTFVNHQVTIVLLLD